MGWFSTLVIAIITAAIGCLLSGYVATLAIRWYSISGFEGGSGYYMIAWALLGLVVGLALGVISSRVVAAMANPGFFKALGMSVATMLAIIGVVGGIGRLRADVGPTIDGEELWVMVEAKYPATQTESPANVPGVSYLQLGSSINHVQRKSVKGALWKEDAQLVDGRWVVTGAVDLFTERGDRTLEIALNDSIKSGFVTRLPRRPGKEYLEWSDWYPRDGRTGPPMEKDVIYRYRVQKVSLPLRVEKLGAFEVGAIARGFQPEIADGTNTLDPFAQFDVKFAGKPISFETLTQDSSTSVKVLRLAKLPSEKPAMLAFLDTEGAESFCALLVDDAGSLRMQRLADCNGGIQADELTTDSARFASLRFLKPAKGRIDKHTYANATLLSFSNMVLNAKTLMVFPYKVESQFYAVPSVHPLAVAPDLQSFASFSSGVEGSGGLIQVKDFVHNKTYELPIDATRMRWADFNDLTPSWTMHHFEWKRGADGTDVLAERAHFEPIPYHGNIEKDGEQTVYRIKKGGEDIRQAFIEYLEKEFGGKRQPVGEYDHEHAVIADGKKLVISAGDNNGYMRVAFAHGETETDLVERAGKGFNTVLATGKYDTVFQK